MLPEDRLSAYEMVRSTWHVTLASWDLLRATLGNGPGSCTAFHHSKILASRIGLWTGLALRFARHLRLMKNHLLPEAVPKREEISAPLSV